MCAHAIIPSIHKVSISSCLSDPRIQGVSCLVSLPKINYLYTKLKASLGYFCWVSQKVENSLLSQQSIALDVYFCACISCNKIVINAEICYSLQQVDISSNRRRHHEIHRLFFVLNRWVLPIHLSNKIRLFLSNL